MLLGATDTGSTARAESSARRLTPEEEGFGDMAHSFSALPSGRPRRTVPGSTSFKKDSLGRQVQRLEFLASRTKTAELVD